MVVFSHSCIFCLSQPLALPFSFCTYVNIFFFFAESFVGIFQTSGYFATKYSIIYIFRGTVSYIVILLLTPRKKLSIDIISSLPGAPRLSIQADFGSGPDLRVVRSSPTWALHSVGSLLEMLSLCPSSYMHVN